MTGVQTCALPILLFFISNSIFSLWIIISRRFFQWLAFVLHMNCLQIFVAQNNIHSILIIVIIIIIIIENALSGTETRSRHLFTNEKKIFFRPKRNSEEEIFLDFRLILHIHYCKAKKNFISHVGLMLHYRKEKQIVKSLKWTAHFVVMI